MLDQPDWSTPARPAFYDRNPLTIRLSQLSVGLGPHGNTQRWTYTVPAGRSFSLGLIYCATTRWTAAAPAAESWNEIRFFPGGGGGGDLINHELISNGVGDGRSVAAGGGSISKATDIYDCQDGDLSTGGTITFVATLQGTEFDA